MFNRPQFPIPETIHPEKNRCICIPVPDDPTYIQVFVGLVHQQTQWFNWFRDDDKNGKEVAQVWKKIFNEIDWSTMSCCCGDDNSVLHRYTPDGHFQKSNDGGATWEDAPGDDPRNPQPFYPPNLDPEEDNTCQYADSVVTLVKTQMVDLLEEGANYSDILEIITSAFITIMAALAPTILGSIIIGIMGAVIVAMITISIPVFVAAMTTDVYNRFRCNLATNIQADGSFTQEDVDAIWAQIADDETGIAQAFLQNFVAAAGVVGLSNAAHAGFGSADAECCPTCSVDSWSIQIWSGNPIGTLIGTGTNYVDVQTEIVPGFGGGYYAQIYTSDADICCTFDSLEILSGGALIAGTALDCGQPLWPTTEVHGVTTPADVNTLRVITDAIATVRFHFI